MNDRFWDGRHGAVVPDLTGDGRPDVMHRARDARELVARRGTDLAELWRIEGLASSPSRAQALGDADGDGTVEFLLSNGDGDLVLDGATGESLWRGDLGQVLRVAGDIDGDGAADAAGFRSTDTGRKDDLTVRHQAVSATGEALYDRTYLVENPNGRAGSAGANALGDVDGDGVTEAEQGLWVFQGESLSGLVSGRTGDLLWRSDEMQTRGRWLSVSLDGAGADRLDLSCPEVSAFDGLSGGLLWSVEEPGCGWLFP